MRRKEYVGRLIPRYYGVRTQEWMQTKEDNVKGDMCSCNGLDYCYNGTKWVLFDSVCIEKKSHDRDAVLAINERIKDIIARLDSLIYEREKREKSGMLGVEIVFVMVFLFVMGFITGAAIV